MEIVRDFFIVKEIDMVALDPERPSVKTKNKIFSKVSRIYACSKNNLLEMVLDVNTEIYPLCQKDELDVLISKIPEVGKDILTDSSDWNCYFGKEKIDLYEYVMHGTIFHSGLEGEQFFVYVSFGGLLLKLFGTIKNVEISDFKIDSKLLLLIRKI